MLIGTVTARGRLKIFNADDVFDFQKHSTRHGTAGENRITQLLTSR